MAKTRRVALITGSATGLGKRIALDMAQAGYDLIITYNHSREKAEKLAQSIRERGVQALLLQANVDQADACEQLVEEALLRFNQVDAFVHAAGPYIFERKEMVEYSLEEWRQMVEGNLSSAFYLSRLLLPSMRRQRRGRMIFFGFDRASTAPGWRYRSAYGAAKVGLVSLTKTPAMEEAPHGITANMVCPGVIMGANKERSIEEVLSVADPETPIGRPVSGGDVSRAVLFFCAEEASALTGNILQVTGGYDALTRSDPPLSEVRLPSAGK